MITVRMHCCLCSQSLTAYCKVSLAREFPQMLSAIRAAHLERGVRDVHLHSPCLEVAVMFAIMNCAAGSNAGT